MRPVNFPHSLRREKGLATMASSRKILGCSIAWLAALLLTSGAAVATPIFSATSSISAGDPTQLGRLSRNGLPQDWSGSEPFPGALNLATSYHYTTLDLDLASLMAPFTAYGPFLQISFDSFAATTFLSAYLDAYDPTDFAANWLGDPGTSGNFFGTDPVFFQVVVPAGHHLILVLNESSPNAGLDLPGNILVEAFADTEYTDLTPGTGVPEPRTLNLLACGLALLVAARRFGRAAGV
jgi:hypothetical protein